MKIKVCGMRIPENIRAVRLLPVDFIGLIFYPSSSRYVGSADPMEIIRATGDLMRIGVFVDADLKTIQETVQRFELYGIQLHGEESPELVARIREAMPQQILIKAFRVGEELPDTSPWEGICDYFLFDAAGPLPGGNGRRFRWEIVQQYQGETPFFLSGGLGPEVSLELQAFGHPQLAGYDLNSRFESSPGQKEIALLDQFLEQLSHAL